MTSDPPVGFNAWLDPWVPVRIDETETVLSLRDVFLRAHEITGLGSCLTPLDRDSLLRLLVSLGAVVAKGHSNDSGAFPMQGIQAVEANHLARFALTGDRPFLQRWDRTNADLAAKVADARGKPVKGLLPLNQLHPHEPGGSSSQWAVRADARDTSDPAGLTLLLVTAWFQTKNGNGQDAFGGKALKGSSGTWHTNPMAVWFEDPTNLANTLRANMPAAWLDGSELPFFLDHHADSALPPKFGELTQATSILRFTYAKTLPLLRHDDRTFLDFMIGADATIPDPGPALGKDIKEQLGRVHEHDHTRLYTEKKTRTSIDLVPRGSFNTRLASTEGYLQWFRSDRGIDSAIKRWASNPPRALTVGAKAAPAWNLTVYSETTDGKGSREWATWDVLPLAVANADPDLRDALRELLEFASECRRAFLPAGRTATGESKLPPAVATGQAAFFGSIHPILLTVAQTMVSGGEADLAMAADRITVAAQRAFAAATDPLMTPRTVSDVARARAEFRRRVRAALRRSPLYAEILTIEDAS